MTNAKSPMKQFLIQFGINLAASALVAYVMYKAMAPKDEGSTTKTVTKPAASEPAKVATPSVEGE